MGLNLFDIVKRKDRALEVLNGSIDPVQLGKPHDYLGAVLTPGAHVRLLRADEFTCLRTSPRDIGWRYLIPHTADAASSVRVEVVAHDGGETPVRSLLCHATTSPSVQAMEAPLLTWPAWTGRSGGFDLELTNQGDAPAVIASSPIFNSRAALTPLLRGSGVEVGPGANPFVMASPDVEVRYLEAAPVSEWIGKYDHKDAVSEEKRAFWDSYIIGDAQRMDICPDNSLDFIFSSHVFEHLVNPIAVLRNWSRKLKPGGVVLSVIPDSRYCFDLRQPPSRPDEWKREDKSDTWTLTQERYEKWCRYTAPYNTPEDLIRRKYSIHAHYYTSDSYLSLVETAIRLGLFTEFFINSSPNNKDFGVALWK
jgi:SAM-dependent methyltransferase